MTDNAAARDVRTDLPDAVERVKSRLGIPERSKRVPHNEFVTYDSARHYAEGYGDNNPLWCDRRYARDSCWGDTIAPPFFPTSAGVPVAVTWSDEQASAMAGGDPLRGIGQYLRAERWVLARPLSVGTRLLKTRGLVRAEIVPSARFVGEVSAVLCYRLIYFDDSTDHVPAAVNEREYVYGIFSSERDAGDSSHNRELAHYDAAALEKIDAAYDSEFRRGSERLDPQALKPGDPLPDIVRGPLTVTDVIAHHVGLGLGDTFGVGALRLAYLNRKRIPAFYNKNRFGAFDVKQRCHWEDDWAQALNCPAAYDYAAMRMNWMANAITNWMGDKACLRSFEGRARRFNYVGDTQWIGGSVVGLSELDGRPTVDLQAHGTNQLGELTCEASATVILGPNTGPPEMPAIPSSMASLASQ